MVTTTGDIFLATITEMSVCTTFLIKTETFFDAFTVHSDETGSTSTSFVAVLIMTCPAITIGLATTTSAISIDFIFPGTGRKYRAFEATDTMSIRMTP